ncbi:hypothetical protein C8J57DRAFT_1247651 [Mycena rebaudengoi]|nr:hypothetical protein C8J57DRAFT_1247651 [Mycena rebaudengoi]
MSNWDHIVLLLSWSYSLASCWVTTSTILLIYGLFLIYLLFVVHVLAIPQENPGRRGKTTLVQYYDENGKLQGWVREERENTKSHTQYRMRLLVNPLFATFQWQNRFIDPPNR